MIDQYDTLAERFLRKGFWLYLFSFIIGPIGYFIKIIISNELTVSEVGILYGIISLMYLLMAFNDLGMNESLKHFIPTFINEKRYDKVKSIIAYTLVAQIITSIFISSIFYFGADFIANNYFNSEEAKKALKIFAFYFVGLNIFQTFESFFVAVQDTFAHKLIELLRNFFILIYVIFIFVLGYSSLENFSYSWIFGLYISTFISLFIFYKKYYLKYLGNEKILIKKKLIKKIFTYAFFVFLGASASTILGQIDMQMIIYMLGTEDAGYYTNYLSIIGIPFVLIGPILSFIFPVVSELYSKKNFDKIKMTKEIFTKNFLIVGIMFNIFFFLFAEILSYTLFGEKFIESGIILKYSILFLIFNFLLQIDFNLMAGIGRVKERLKIISIAIIVNIITNIVFINIMGVYGAALATGLGWILIWIMSEISLGKEYLVKWDLKVLFKNIFILGIIAVISYKYLIWNYSEFSRIESFFLLGICFLIWSGIFVGINGKTFKSFFKEVKKLKK